MQKLASLGYVGLQKTSTSSAAVTGADPKEKDRIAIANKVIAISSPPIQMKPERAIATLAPIVSADPDIFLAQYGLGVELARKGEFAEAVKHLHKAIELQPESAWAHFEMGASLLKTGDYKTAIVHLEIATGHLPNFSPAHQDLAEAYDHAGRAEDAKRERGKLGQK
jgi:tetratricopeptide (TPR) repeat protein